MPASTARSPDFVKKSENSAKPSQPSFVLLGNVDNSMDQKNISIEDMSQPKEPQIPSYVNIRANTLQRSQRKASKNRRYFELMQSGPDPVTKVL